MAKSEIPLDLDECAARYRSTLAGQRILTVLDNVEEAGQVRPLLPACPGCAIVVASHRRLAAVDFQYSVSVEALTSHKALEMITDCVGAERVAKEPVSAQRLIDLCDRLGLLSGSPGHDWPADPEVLYVTW